MKIQSTRDRLGFSSVEFLAAIVISLILSVIAFAGYQMYERELPVKHAARRLAHAFATARTYAVANNSYYTVKIDWQYKNFWIDETNESGATVLPKVVSPELLDEKVEIESIMFGANLAPQVGSVTPIKFTPTGSSDDVQVGLKMTGASSEDKNIYTIRLYGPTGMSRVFERQRLTTTTP